MVGVAVGAAVGVEVGVTVGVLVSVGVGVAVRVGVWEGTITAGGLTCGAQPVNKTQITRENQNTERIFNTATSFYVNIYLNSDMIRGRQF